MHGTLLQSLEALKKKYDAARQGKESLLRMIEEVELPESVYNSNAIENSTLTLDETEKILLYHLIPAHHSQREIFEATNLARVTEYLSKKVEKNTPLTEELLCHIHGTLLTHIADDVAGRFRQRGEYVRVGRHIAPPPEEVPNLMDALLRKYKGGTLHPLERIVYFHPEFERIHPFCDGNGRAGRAILNFQLKEHGYPPIIVQNKEKQEYYHSLVEYETKGTMKGFERIIGRLLKESFHKRLTYLHGDSVVPLAGIVRKESSRNMQSVLTLAKRQSLPAFRERGHWKVGGHAFEIWLRRQKR